MAERARARIAPSKPSIIRSTRANRLGERTTLADAWVNVTRSREQTDTTYNFSPAEIEPLNPADFEGIEIKSIDFSHEPEFQPLPAHDQAVLLGVPNPFKQGGVKKDDEDDDEKDSVMETAGRGAKGREP